MPVPKTLAARRTQVERTETMRTRLAAAAYETIAENGLTGLRLRAVATAAGVSQGALLHHFRDKNALTLAAIEHALTLAREDSSNWLETDAIEPASILRAMLAELRSFFYSDRFWVAIGITMEAAKDPSLNMAARECVAALRTPIYQAWVERLAAAGWQREAAARAVRSGAAMVSGTAIRRFWTEDDAITEEIAEEWILDHLPQAPRS